MATAARGGAACTADLAPLAQSGDGALRAIALHVLACCGGPAALSAVKSALNDKDEAVQDEAVRTLSNWPNRWPEDAAVMEPLMALVKSGKKATHQILALRGTLQYLQGNKSLKDGERMTRVSEVLPLATRPDEKRLAISVLGITVDARALEMLATLAEDAAVMEEACSAIVSLAGKDWKGTANEQRRKALTAAAGKTKSGSTRRKAQELLKAVP